MEILAIKPSRKGPKELPGENTKMFCNRPLIAWTVNEVKKCKSVSRVSDSTDDSRARSIVLSLGIEVLVC